jgi:hypothetical protein
MQKFHQSAPAPMVPHPVDEDPNYKGSGKLGGKVALVAFNRSRTLKK